MKRTSLAVLLLAVLLALTACGGEEKPRAEGVVYAPERVDFQTGLLHIVEAKGGGKQEGYGHG